MPLGWERINSKKSDPNKNIVFIKPLPGPLETLSRDYLERIAAQCLPIMNKNHLAVVSLEEYEPNLEFWGRNFNNGEVIQLVLKSPSTGRWLPFKFVQMVMMHELAHCKEMNHSKAFWKVRNEYASAMKELWVRGYTGDGLWGRGVLLENGMFAREELDESEILPEHMCGGTFKSRGRKKRKVKPKITYKEQKERRIRRKFGVNGMTLGTDEEAKIKLEKGKKPRGKPRVAGSARGRELRAAAALARFEVKREEESQIKDEELVTDSDSESGDDFQIKTEPDDAVDIDGTRLVDSKGHGMVRVCDDEDRDDENVKQELEELQSMRNIPTVPQSGKKAVKPATSLLHFSPLSTALGTNIPSNGLQDSKGSRSPNQSELTSSLYKSAQIEKQTPQPKREIPGPSIDASCRACSVVNDEIALTCIVCANVLKPDFVHGSWKCQTSTCKESEYINAGDVGICGICGVKKS